MSVIIPKSNEIKKARIKSGFSLRGLAIKTKTHYSTLSNIENSKGNITPRVAKAICEALNKDFDDFFEIVEKSKLFRGGKNNGNTCKDEDTGASIG